MIPSLTLPVITRSDAGIGRSAAPRSPRPGMRNVPNRAKNVSRIKSPILNFFASIPLRLSKGILNNPKDHLL